MADESAGGCPWRAVPGRLANGRVRHGADPARWRERGEGIDQRSRTRRDGVTYPVRSDAVARYA